MHGCQGGAHGEGVRRRPVQSPVDNHTRCRALHASWVPQRQAGADNAVCCRRYVAGDSLPGGGWGADGPGRTGRDFGDRRTAVARRVALPATVPRRVTQRGPRTASKGPAAVWRPV
eukprot:357631-Chlamydomonas_euryale.AAC.3